MTTEMQLIVQKGVGSDHEVVALLVGPTQDVDQLQNDFNEFWTRHFEPEKLEFSWSMSDAEHRELRIKSRQQYQAMADYCKNGEVDRTDVAVCWLIQERGFRRLDYVDFYGD